MASKREYELVAKLLAANLSRHNEVFEGESASAARAARQAIVDVTCGLADTFEGLSANKPEGAKFDRERFYLASGLTNTGNDPVAVERFTAAVKALGSQRDSKRAGNTCKGSAR